MKSHIAVMRYYVLILTIMLTMGPAVLFAAERLDLVPPQFLTAPVHAPEQIQDLISGRLTFAASKSPAQAGGGATGASTSTATFSLITQTDAVTTDAVSRRNSSHADQAIAN